MNTIEEIKIIKKGVAITAALFFTVYGSPKRLPERLYNIIEWDCFLVSQVIEWW